MTKKLISARVDEKTYDKIKLLAYYMSFKSKEKVTISDLIEEAFEHYIKEHQEYFSDER